MSAKGAIFLWQWERESSCLLADSGSSLCPIPPLSCPSVFSDLRNHSPLYSPDRISSRFMTPWLRSCPPVSFPANHTLSYSFSSSNSSSYSASSCFSWSSPWSLWLCSCPPVSFRANHTLFSFFSFFSSSLVLILVLVLVQSSSWHQSRLCFFLPITLCLIYHSTALSPNFLVGIVLFIFVIISASSNV